MSTLRISPYPYGRTDKVPIGVLHSGGIVEEGTGSKIIYCDSPKPAIRYTRLHGGTALISRTRGSTRWIRFETNGKTIYPGTYCTDINELIGFRNYCHSIGIPPGGIASMGLRLMRYTLPGYFDIERGEEIPWDKFPPGARMHSRPGVYRNVAQADITAAYLWSIGQQSPVSMFHEERRPSQKTMREFPGSWALVSYRYSDRPQFGIFPEINTDGTTGFPATTRIWHGPILMSSWDIENLRGLGVDISIDRGWIATRIVTQPFRAFMHLIMDLREKFPNVAKQAGNSLWGTFGASTDLYSVEYVPGRTSHKIRKIPPREALSIPVSALTLSRLRAELAGISSSPSTVHVHTDGFMTTSLNKYPTNRESSPGEWRLANRFMEVEIQSPSWYRTVSYNGEESFKLAGRPERGYRARAIFRHARDREGRLF